jgi:hypothetical protein
MGLLDDFFGKEEINQLKAQLAEKIKEIAAEKIKSFEAKVSLTKLESQVATIKSAVADRESVINSLKSALDDTQSKNFHLLSELEKIEFSALDQKVQAEKTISHMQASIAKVEAEALSAAKARESIERHWNDVRESYDSKDQIYQEREAKLAEMSEKLHIDQRESQLLAADLRTREEDWKHRIEPQLRAYEEHASLESKSLQLQKTTSQIENLRLSIESQQSDLVRRKKLTEKLEADLKAKSKELSRQRLEHEARTYKLEEWARELSAFRDRIDQIDVENENIKTKKKKEQAEAEHNRAQYLEQLVELRQERSALKRLENNLIQREAFLKTKENNARLEESQIARTRDNNIELRKEQRRLTSLTESLDASNRAAQSKIKRLIKKTELIKSIYDKTPKQPNSTEKYSKNNSLLTNAKIFSWLLEDNDPNTHEIKNGWLGSTGSGPWPDTIFKTGLEDPGYQFYPMPDDELEYVIVGKKGWSKADLLAQIEARAGQSLRIYSQEMFFAKLVAGKDPFDAEDVDLLDAFAEDHPALQFLMTLPVPWPTIIGDESGAIIEADSEDFGVSESPLHILGYRVGSTSDLSTSRRRKILTECFESNGLTFSEDSDHIYVAKWGRGGSAQRLYRIAAHIKSLADGPVGKDPRKPQSRLDWISDLKWLKLQYFSNYKVKFSWPGS